MQLQCRCTSAGAYLTGCTGVYIRSGSVSTIVSGLAEVRGCRRFVHECLGARTCPSAGGIVQANRSLWGVVVACLAFSFIGVTAYFSGVCKPWRSSIQRQAREGSGHCAFCWQGLHNLHNGCIARASHVMTQLQSLLLNQTPSLLHSEEPRACCIHTVRYAAFGLSYSSSFPSILCASTTTSGTASVSLQALQDAASAHIPVPWHFEPELSASRNSVHIC